MLLLIGTYSLCPFIHVSLSLSCSLTLFLSLVKADCLGYLAVLVSWRCILSVNFFSGKPLILPYMLIESLAAYRCLICRPLFFIFWSIFCHSLLACCVSVEKSAASLIGVPLYVTSYFSLAAFKILSLPLKLGILIIICFGVDLFGFILIWTLCGS